MVSETILHKVPTLYQLICFAVSSDTYHFKTSTNRKLDHSKAPFDFDWAKCDSCLVKGKDIYFIQTVGRELYAKHGIDTAVWVLPDVPTVNEKTGSRLDTDIRREGNNWDGVFQDWERFIFPGWKRGGIPSLLWGMRKGCAFGICFI